MYIRFECNHSILYPVLESEIENWSQQTHIPYKLKSHKIYIKLTLPTESDYSAFCLFWGSKESHTWFPYQTIEPMKVDNIK